MSSPHLEVLDEGLPRDAAHTPRSHQLLQAIAARLQLPADVAEQLALTHTLACLQAHAPLHLQVLVDPVSDHKTELGHA